MLIRRASARAALAALATALPLAAAAQSDPAADPVPGDRWVAAAGAGGTVHLHEGPTDFPLAALLLQRGFRSSPSFEYVPEAVYARTFGPDGFVAGVLPLGLRWKPRERLPHVSLAAGFGWTDLEGIPEIDRRFNYLVAAGIGHRWPAGRRRDWFSELRLFHVSNAGTRGRNLGVNTWILLVGRGF